MIELWLDKERAAVTDEIDKPKRRIIEVIESAVPTLVGGIVTLKTSNPVLGAAANVATKEALRTDFVGRVARRVAGRLDRFVDATSRALPRGFNLDETNAHFDDAVFQNYRRAMDAVDEAVIPALGHLTASYCDRPADAFFRGTGRVLEDLTASEFETLQQVVSAVILTGEEVVQVVPRAVPRGPAGAMEVLLYTHAPRRSEIQAWLIPVRPDEVRRCLRLLDRNDLVFESYFRRETAQSLQDLFEAVPVELVPTTVF